MVSQIDWPQANNPITDDWMLAARTTEFPRTSRNPFEEMRHMKWMSLAALMVGFAVNSAAIFSVISIIVAERNFRF